MVTEHIDFILNKIEKYNYYCDWADFFSKYRAFPFIGLSAGFCIDTDMLIRANVTGYINIYLVIE